MGMKCPDSECIPLTNQCHVSLHERLGMFRGRSKQWIRDWQDEAIRVTQKRYADARHVR